MPVPAAIVLPAESSTRSPNSSGPFAPRSGSGWPDVRLTLNAGDDVKNGMLVTSGTLNTATRVPGSAAWIELSEIVINWAKAAPVLLLGGGPATPVGPESPLD